MPVPLPLLVRRSSFNQALSVKHLEGVVFTGSLVHHLLAFRRGQTQVSDPLNAFIKENAVDGVLVDALARAVTADLDPSSSGNQTVVKATLDKLVVAGKGEANARDGQVIYLMVHSDGQGKLMQNGVNIGVVARKVGGPAARKREYDQEAPGSRWGKVRASAARTEFGVLVKADLMDILPSTFQRLHMLEGIEAYLSSLVLATDERSFGVQMFGSVRTRRNMNSKLGGTALCVEFV